MKRKKKRKRDTKKEIEVFFFREGCQKRKSAFLVFLFLFFFNMRFLLKKGKRGKRGIQEIRSKSLFFKQEVSLLFLKRVFFLL